MKNKEEELNSIIMELIERITKEEADKLVRRVKI
jgi:hypothetical protein